MFKKVPSESTMAIIAGMLVLFTTMLNPLVSALLAVVLLFLFASLSRKRNTKR